MKMMFAECTEQRNMDISKRWVTVDKVVDLFYCKAW